MIRESAVLCGGDGHNQAWKIVNVLQQSWGHKTSEADERQFGGRKDSEVQDRDTRVGPVQEFHSESPFGDFPGGPQC